MNCSARTCLLALQCWATLSLVGEEVGERWGTAERERAYYRVVNEFFSEKLGNFVEPDHKCACNVCCLDLEALKQKAVEEALAALEARKASADSAGVNQNSNG